MEVGSLLEEVRRKAPVVHHLTNWVTIYDCANIVKVFGASPVMAHAPEEVEEMVGIASALVLNIGTLTVEFVESMKKAARRANARSIPVVLDVCGAGATRLRDAKCAELLEAARIDLVKGNASEIARVAGEAVATRGVDAAEVEKDLAELARALARARSCTVVVTGREDIVTDGVSTFRIKNGHEMMSRVVGTGCMAASVIGAFAGVERERVRAAVAGLVSYEVAAELAARSARGPGSFKEALFDAVAGLDASTVEQMKRVVAS
ncbi:MAG TPA: hydroxyethylthiazole kinase [Anaeromyxobacteraceae bacterium]|nr:hydroxyethylthiazole kinase [Anaeromyxobacteraceae bacterium]